MATSNNHPSVKALSVQTTPLPPFEQAWQLIADANVDAYHAYSPACERDRLLQSLRDDDLERMHKQLWYAGRRGNISPLHHQRVLGREVVLTERARLHLIWSEKTIYVKRLEDELLNRKYFLDIACRDDIIHQAATGFLASYMYLVQYPSDLDIAKHLGLINGNVVWPSWQAFRSSILHHLADRSVHDRFEYGELRLGRLNQVYRMRCMGMTYFTIHRDYWSYFGHNYMTLVALFALVSVGLSAMQVMTAYDHVPAAVMLALYRCSIATLVAMTASCALLLILYLGLYVWNWTLVLLRRGSRGTGGGPT